MNLEDKNLLRLKYLLNNIQQNLYFIMNNINEIESILNFMKNEGLDNNPNFLLLNNQFNLMRNNFNNNIMNNNLNKKLNITFRKTGISSSINRPVTIKCEKNEKIRDIIKRYREKSGDNDENLKFIFNARELKLESTLEQEGLREGSYIFVVPIKF